MAARYDRDRANQWVTENSDMISATERAVIDRLLGQLDVPTASPVSLNNPSNNTAASIADEE